MLTFVYDGTQRAFIHFNNSGKVWHGIRIYTCERAILKKIDNRYKTKRYEKDSFCNDDRRHYDDGHEQ